MEVWHFDEQSLDAVIEAPFLGFSSALSSPTLTGLNWSYNEFDTRSLDSRFSDGPEESGLNDTSKNRANGEEREVADHQMGTHDIFMLDAASTSQSGSSSRYDYFFERRISDDRDDFTYRRNNRRNRVKQPTYITEEKLRPRPISLLSIQGCQYCKSINRFFLSLSVEDCPQLAQLKPCGICGAAGRENHTAMYCPLRQIEKLLFVPKEERMGEL